MKRNIFILLVVFVGIAAVYLYREYNRRPVYAANAKAEHIVSAPGLIKEFETDEQAASEKYSNKVTQVQGVLTSFDVYNGVTTISLGGSSNASNVRCTMDNTDPNIMTPIPIGTLVTVKGICVGFNKVELIGSDVLMNKAIVMSRK